MRTSSAVPAATAAEMLAKLSRDSSIIWPE